METTLTQSSPTLMVLSNVGPSSSAHLICRYYPRSHAPLSNQVHILFLASVPTRLLIMPHFFFFTSCQDIFTVQRFIFLMAPQKSPQGCPMGLQSQFVEKCLSSFLLNGFFLLSLSHDTLSIRYPNQKPRVIKFSSLLSTVFNHLLITHLEELVVIDYLFYNTLKIK